MTTTPYKIPGPYKGIISDMPAPTIPQAFDNLVNWVCRKGRLTTRPRLVQLGSPPDGAPIRYVGTLQDIVNSLHNIVLTTQHAYMVTTDLVWHVLTGYAPGLATLTSAPYGTDKVLNRLYFSNGSDYLNYIDGESSVKKSGDTPGGCLYLAHNASHLIQGFTFEPIGTGQRAYPRRIRWSVSGVQTGSSDDWSGFGSGVEDLLEVSDVITGLATVGPYTYVWRTDGITLMAPTGDFTGPFAIENISQSDAGIGNVYPNSLDVFNNSAAFVAKDDIYLMTEGQSFERLAGGKAKKAIFDDLAKVSRDSVNGWIMPHLGPGFDFLAYFLNIPGPNITWVYSREDDAWQKFTTSMGWVTAMGWFITG